jgi:hypothetical protein
MDNIREPGSYAYLPDELLSQILEGVPATVDKMNVLFDIQDEPIQKGITFLRDNKFIESNSEIRSTGSLIAVDGSCIIDKMSGADLLLVVALGVEGLTEDSSKEWGANNNQYIQWQTVLPHGEANNRLAQGVMFLMELSVLANAKHDIRIMDGAHFTSVLKINSMLSAKEENADEEYLRALKNFLKETYGKIIPDIPDIINSALSNDSIVALAKYSSSRDIINAYIPEYGIVVDDKTFFSLTLQENEYLKPMSVGQSNKERQQIWNDLHIKCNLDLGPEGSMSSEELRNKLNTDLETVISSLTTKNGKKSNLFFTYYKPYQYGPAYRIELKKSLAEDKTRLETYLNSIKLQIVLPEIREPYPQYLVDLMAKSISIGLIAIKEAVKLSPDFKMNEKKFDLLRDYRT